MTDLDSLKQQFNGHVAFRERRPGVLQVLAPLFHEDGDMVDIFLDEPVNGSGKVRIGDHGLMLMRLTYIGIHTLPKAAHASNGFWTPVITFLAGWWTVIV